MSDGDMDISAPAVHMMQSSNEGVGKTIETPNRTPPCGKRKLKALRQLDNSVTGGADKLASDSHEFGVDTTNLLEPDGEEVKAFAALFNLYARRC